MYAVGCFPLCWITIFKAMSASSCLGFCLFWLLIFLSTCLTCLHFLFMDCLLLWIVDEPALWSPCVPADSSIHLLGCHCLYVTSISVFMVVNTVVVKPLHYTLQSLVTRWLLLCLRQVYWALTVHHTSKLTYFHLLPIFFIVILLVLCCGIFRVGDFFSCVHGCVFICWYVWSVSCVLCALCLCLHDSPFSPLKVRNCAFKILYYTYIQYILIWIRWLQITLWPKQGAEKRVSLQFLVPLILLLNIQLSMTLTLLLHFNRTDMLMWGP